MTIVTPMMRQYQAVKEQYSDCLLFFRLGDFYELFNDDAITASRELGLVLTKRAGGEIGAGDKVPMCGVPHHAAENYLARLIAKGYKVAICEQLEDPKTAKGIVKRDVIRVVTPGTVMEDSMLQDKAHNFLAACWRGMERGRESGFGLAYVDIASGEFLATEIRGPAARQQLADELTRIAPSELLVQDELRNDPFFQERAAGGGCVLSRCYDQAYIAANSPEIVQIHFQVASVEGLGLGELPLAIKAAAMILDFLQQTQKRSLSYIAEIKVYGNSDFMLLDAATRRNLELTETLRTGKRKGSLLWVLDETKTAMGGRLLREWVESPLLATAAIRDRLVAVSELFGGAETRRALRDILSRLYDLPRLISRVSYGSATPRDLAALRSTLAELPAVFTLLADSRSPLLRLLFNELDVLDDLSDLLGRALSDEPPVQLAAGGVIREQYNSELDELRQLTGSAKQLLLDLEARERERTGIKSLKVGYNKVFGYYIEISRSRAGEAPADYIRKQTLTNGERFITEELKQLETRMLSAGERLAALESSLFADLRRQVADQGPRVIRTGQILAQVDVLCSLAQVAEENNYCCPDVDDGGSVIIREGRHPVIEKIIGPENYISNDTRLDRFDQRMMLITGPNMTGKSTYMRQVALTVLMARMGSFVPAEAAHVGYVDRIFTRVGAADDLTSGQSTFMVEMNETSNILHNATEHSLIVLDEIGRGTSTYDGLSIAWAVAEYIIDDKCGAKTLFATHYHELTALADSFPAIRNWSIAVKEKGSTILFLRKIVAGGTDKSYGIQVAQLAGLPKEVIRRAKEILSQLEAEKHIAAKLERSEQITFADLLLGQSQPEEAAQLKELRELDVDRLTPLEALLLLARWKKELDER